ncbi:MAG: hypothetical protein OEZ08_13335 [Betaproteobacteria bacterium]|nr:hypothetical protein [Betaproteobacteria bacterium]
MAAADWRRARLVLLRPPDNPHPYAFSEAIEFLLHSLRELGCAAEAVENEFIRDGTNILFGAHLLSRAVLASLPPNCVVYNAEQMGSGSSFDNEVYREALSRYPVWDYSARNVEHLRGTLPADRVCHVPIGYAPPLTRIAPAAAQDIDVLFYGSMNERRKAVLDDLRQADLAVHYAYGVYGAERDALIARAKVVLNVHFFRTKIFEIFRVSYLLANRKAVVSECSAETEIDPRLREALVLVRYDEIAEACRALASDRVAREKVGARGFECFSRLTFRDELSRAMQSTRF